MALPHCHLLPNLRESRHGARVAWVASLQPLDLLVPGLDVVRKVKLSLHLFVIAVQCVGKGGACDGDFLVQCGRRIAERCGA